MAYFAAGFVRFADLPELCAGGFFAPDCPGCERFAGCDDDVVFGVLAPDVVGVGCETVLL
jgi:hypothetical protein